MRPILALSIAATALLGACATDQQGADATPAYVVVEENASIDDRRDIRRTSVLEDDVLLIETRPGDYYRVDLVGPCVSITDVMTPVRVDETGMGIDRSTRFRVGERTCFVRSVTKVERAPRPTPAEAETRAPLHPNSKACSRPQSYIRVPRGSIRPLADLYIDPMRPVARALITHGHSDHARAGHGAVLATAETLAIMEARYGPGFAGATQALTYGERIDIGGVTFSLHSAGHVLGSAQAAVEATARAWSSAATTSASPIRPAPPFEVVPCDVFISEATFALAGVHASERRARSAQAAGLRRHVSRARAHRRRVCARQGAARDGDVARSAGGTSRSTCTARCWR